MGPEMSVQVGCNGAPFMDVGGAGHVSFSTWSSSSVADIAADIGELVRFEMGLVDVLSPALTLTPTLLSVVIVCTCSFMAEEVRPTLPC
jgi:hypothetical protein